MTDKHTPTAPPPVYRAEFNWQRLLILHVLTGLLVIATFPAPWNFAIGTGFLALYGLRYRFFNRPALVLEGDRIVLQPLGHKLEGRILQVNVRGAGNNIVTGGWITVDLKGFGRRRLTIYPLQDPLVAAATLKAATSHFKALEESGA